MTAGPDSVGGPSGSQPPPRAPAPGQAPRPDANAGRPVQMPGTAPAAALSSANALVSGFGAVLAAAAGRIAGTAAHGGPSGTAAHMVIGPDGASIPVQTAAAVPTPAPATRAPAAPPTPGTPAAPPGTTAARLTPMAGADAPARAALVAYGALPFLATYGRGIGGDTSLRGAQLLARLSAADGGARPAAVPAQPLPPYAPLPGPAAAPIDPAHPTPPRTQPQTPPQDDDQDTPPARGLVKVGLLRHFPTDWNAQGRLQGRTDIPLSDASRTALRGLRLPPHWRDLPILCSPLTRARETAAILGETGSVIFDDRLMEMDFGDWEGAIAADLLADPDCAYGPVEGWGWDFRPPNGETPADMLARVGPVLEEAAAIGPCLIICHRGMMRAIMAAATGWPYLGTEPFRIRRARVHPVMLSAAGTPVALGAPEKLAPRA
ncbi:MAG: broad specificity phosphatase PhoE [Paracoccaceae bacterium]|jgi:broad specificity phosphatase PhoE